MSATVSTQARSAAGSAVVPGSVHAWLIALRPRSLLIAVSPVVVGAALAYERTGNFDLTIAWLALAAAVMLQVITNLQNDVGYTVRGGEQAGNRIGLPRATAHGWLSVAQVRRAIAVAVTITLALGLPLVLERGWPVLAMGLASIAAALAYMGGPRPIAYSPFGELTVFVFFGLIAVVGTDYVMTGGYSSVTWLAAAALGGLASAALAINNHRDAEHDRSAARRTLPVMLGTAVSARLFALSLLGPFALLVPMAWVAAAPWLLAPMVLLPAARRLYLDFARCPGGLAFNAVLFRTFKMELKFSALLAGGAVLTRVVA